MRRTLLFLSGIPQVWLDGMNVRPDALSYLRTSDLEAVEVYRGFEAPPRVQ